jgi:hypothetical protein
MVILSHAVEKDQEIEIPQMGWPGTMVFLPPKAKPDSGTNDVKAIRL